MLTLIEINLLSGQSQLRGEKLANIEKDKERIANEGLSQKRERERKENVAELSITKDQKSDAWHLLQTDLITKTISLNACRLKQKPLQRPSMTTKTKSMSCIVLLQLKQER